MAWYLVPVRNTSPPLGLTLLYSDVCLITMLDAIGRDIPLKVDLC